MPTKRKKTSTTQKHPGGRPLKFKTVRELQKKIEEYFLTCWTKKLDQFGNPIKDKETGEQIMFQFKPYTITGLAVSLDTTRDTLLDYEDRDKFSDTIKRAKEQCHQYAEEQLYIGKNPTGAIFNLKNNYGWKDKREIEIKDEPDEKELRQIIKDAFA